MTVWGDFRRILLIRRKGLGDALVSLPAVLEVARAWPGARIDLVIDRPFAPLVADLAAEVTVLPWPPPPGESWFGRLRRGRYDLVIDWLGNPRTALWTVLTAAPVRVGYDLPRRRWAYNVKVPRNRETACDLRGFAGEAFMDPLRCLGLEPPPWRDGFARAALAGANSAGARADLAAFAERWLARPGVPVVVVASASWPAKMWPAAQVRELLMVLPERGFNPVLVPGPADDWLVDGVAPVPAEVIAPQTSLPELAYLLGQTRLFVGTDCGPRHLAVALGVPSVTLFGPTDPRGWNPATPQHVSVRNPVPCAPCDLIACPVAGHPCLDDLSAGTVIANVERLWARTGERGSGEAHP